MPNSYAATNPKKFLDANGLAHFAQKLNEYPTNDVIAAVIDGVQDALDEKIDITEKGAMNGVAPLDENAKILPSNLPVMVGATGTESGVTGSVPPATSLEAEMFLRGDGTWADGGRPMVVLSYGHSTWAEFQEAYNNNVIVYCKASSNSNPASGTQSRMAFFAYLGTTNVEFQYYRSVNQKSGTQQGDQVYVYALDNKSKWTVTVRENYTKVVAGTGLSSTYAAQTITLNAAPMTGATSSADGVTGSVPAPTSADADKYLKGDGTWDTPADTNTTYSLSQDEVDGHTILFTGTDGTSTSITIPDNNTTYASATQSTDGLMSASDKQKLDAIAEGATANTGTITGITMNGASKGTSGVVDLGTVITEHQDISGKLNTSLKGAVNGLAELDENGKVPASQLPSYVDDVLEFNGTSAFPATGEAGKIYVDISTGGGNKTYRWGGSSYVEISPSITLGATSSTAFRGDYGDVAYQHATNKGAAFTSGLYKITTNAEGHVTAATSVEKSDITSLGVPAQDTTYTFDGSYNASTNKAATVKTVTDAIGALDGDITGTAGAGKTITAFSQTNGNVSATFSDISITKSQVSDLGIVGIAATKGVDDSISAGSTSQDLPTSQAVASFVEGKGYKTTDNNTTYTITQDTTDAHKFTFAGSDGSTTTITIPDNNTEYTLQSLGIGNVKNYDQSKAIKSISRTGLTFTYTCLDNTTGTFTQKDDDTWIAMVGATSSSNGTAGYVPAPPKANYDSAYLRADGNWIVPPNDDTKNTAGSTNTSEKIYLVGATTQAANPQTYSHSTAYVGTDGCLYSEGLKVLTAHQDITGKVDKNQGAANAGKALIVGSNGMLELGVVQTDISSKVDIDQGSQNAGKFLVVGNSGQVELYGFMAAAGQSF